MPLLRSIGSRFSPLRFPGRAILFLKKAKETGSVPEGACPLQDGLSSI
ncbi:hypothetical protein SAMN05444162_2106 [Paenibacillaceae bacterium GAS479]|nr:hypothetical protein SAMN05444162_2106 [Paenibacillaceae bacterium GAS479]